MRFKAIGSDDISIQRFLSKVRVNDGCHEWTGCVGTPLPYGRFGIQGISHYAHRVSYILFVGSIPKGKLVCHRCDNPRCVRPSHLFLGTQSENVIDSFHKGRTVRSAGTKHPRAKLSLANIHRILELRHSGLGPKAISERLNLKRYFVSNVIYGTNWRSLSLSLRN